MLAAVAGASLGSAKRVTPVMARVRRGQEGGGGNCPLDYLDALVAVADVYANAPLRPAETKGVVNLSWEYSETLFQLATNFAGDVAWWCWRKRLGAVIREIVDKGLLVVIGAGNEMEVIKTRHSIPPEHKSHTVTARRPRHDLLCAVAGLTSFFFPSLV